MTELKGIKNKQLLQKLQNRLHNKKLTEQGINELLEAEQWKRAYRLADADRRCWIMSEKKLNAGKSIDKQRLGDKLGKLDARTTLKVDEVLVKLFLYNTDQKPIDKISYMFQFNRFFHLEKLGVFLVRSDKINE